MISITATIDRLEEDTAVLKTSDGKEIFLPKDQLQDMCAVGKTIQLTLNSDENQTLANKNQAKDILNEILDSNRSWNF